MSATDSAARWLERLEAGDPAAASAIWTRHFQRLIKVARRRLGGAARGMADEEDMAATAMETFLRRAHNGQFATLRTQDELWRLLVAIVERKASNYVRDQRRQKRGNGRVAGDLACPRTRKPAPQSQLLSDDPAPDEAAACSEEFQRLLELLGDDELREIALAKLDGYSNAEIALRIGRSLPTVERRLRLIRGKWSQECAR